jgi:hypothetical protein
MATSAVLPHRAGHLLKRVIFRTDEVMVLEDPGQPVGDLRRGDPPTHPPDRIPWAHGGQQRLVLGGGLLRRCPAGQQFQEQPVQPVQRLRAGAGQLARVDHTQQPQNRQLGVGPQLPQPLVPQRDHHDGVRVGGVGSDRCAPRSTNLKLGAVDFVDWLVSSRQTWG